MTVLWELNAPLLNVDVKVFGLSHVSAFIIRRTHIKVITSYDASTEKL